MADTAAASDVAEDMAVPPPPLPPVVLPSPMTANNTTAVAAPEFGLVDAAGPVAETNNLTAPMQQDVPENDRLVSLDGIMAELQSLQGENGGSLVVPSSHPVSSFM